MTYVVDASALISAFVGPLTRVFRGRLVGAATHAPHLIDAEVGHALRRLVLRGLVANDDATGMLASAPRLVDRRYPHTGVIAAHAWVLRANLSYYDALYVALAAALDLPLLTADRRLAAMPDPPCVIELVA